MFVGSEEAFIILQNTLLTGVTDISFDYSAEQETNILLSNKGINRKTNKPSVATCSITKKYLGRDFLKELTGFVGLSGQFIYGQDALDFTEAAISSYKIQMSAAKAPEISVDLKIYGDLKPTTNLRSATAVPDHEIRTLDLDFLSFNFMNKNSAIDDFSFSADFEIKPTYEIESQKSSTIKIITPAKFSTSAKIEMTEQEYEDITGLFDSEGFDRQFHLIFVDKRSVETIKGLEERYLDLTGSGLDTGLYNFDFGLDTGAAVLDDYSFGNFGLSSQDIGVTPKDTIQLSVGYDGYGLNLPTGLPRSTPLAIKTQIEEFTEQVEAVINEFTAWYELPKFTGEDFESIETGEYASPYISLADRLYGTNEEDFESFQTGETDNNLINFDPGTAPGSTIKYQEEDFESDPTGDYSTNIVDSLYFFETYSTNQEDFESFNTGATDQNLYYFG